MAACLACGAAGKRKKIRFEVNTEEGLCGRWPPPLSTRRHQAKDLVPVAEPAREDFIVKIKANFTASIEHAIASAEQAVPKGK